MQCVEYTTLADKRERYVKRTIPLIVETASHAAAAGFRPPASVSSPARLHEWIRAGRYVEENEPRDCIPPVHDTLKHGGDCEDWAAVELAAARALNIPARLVMAGDDEDPFRHVYVELWDAGRWVPSDPKGSQTGRDYGLHSDWPVKRVWDGGKVRGSGASPAQLNEFHTVRQDEPPGHFTLDQIWKWAVPNLVRLTYQAKGGPATPKQVQPQTKLQAFHAAMQDLRARVPDAFLEPVSLALQAAVNNWGDAYRALSDDQISLWLWFASRELPRAGGKDAGTIIQDRLRAGNAGYTRSEILRFIRFHANRPGAGSRPGGIKLRPATLDPLEDARTLEEINTRLAGRWVAEMLEPGPESTRRKNVIRDLAAGLDAKPSISDTQKGAVVAAWLALIASSRGIALDELFAAAAGRGTLSEVEAVSLANSLAGGAVDLSAEPSAQPAAQQTAERVDVQQRMEQARARLFGSGWSQVQGSGNVFNKIASGFSTLVRHPLKWFRRVFVTEVGKGIARAAQNILNADDVPFLGQYILRPMGFMLQAQVLKQLGAAMVDGSISTFDERAVAFETAGTLAQTGQALIAASPMLPPPFNVAAAAVGGLSLAAGITLNNELTRKEREQPTQVSFCVDQAGRKVDCQTGIPFDPFERQAWEREQQQQQAAQQPDPQTQQPGEWRFGQDGLAYGWWHWNTQSWWWTALQVDQAGQPVAAWVYTQQGWRAL